MTLQDLQQVTVCYKWLSADCIIHPVTDSWELVEMRMLSGKPCAIVKRKKPCKRASHYL